MCGSQLFVCDSCMTHVGWEVFYAALTGTEGVRDRNSTSTTFMCQVLGWELAVSQRAGFGITYRWVADHVQATIAACAGGGGGRGMEVP